MSRRRPSAPNPRTGPLVEVVIPCLNEVEALPRLLGDLAQLEVAHGVVVADGGSRDGTPELAEAWGARVVASAPGRARQMNAGAAVARAPWLCFLHADVRLPPSARTALALWLARAGPRDFGTFAFAVDAPGRMWRLVEAGQRLREGLLGLAYGDQGLLLSAGLFREVGGFPPLPFLEDVAILKTLRKVGTWKKIPAALPSSPRRYLQEGFFRAWLRNALVIGLYLAGADPHKLVRLYPSRGEGSHPSSRTLRGSSSPAPGEPPPRQGAPAKGGGYPPGERRLLVFVKEPVMGRVKTRLAREVGGEEAARIYRELGRQVVDSLRGGAYRLTVLFDPPEAREAVGRWLGEEGVEFRPQAPGDLGQRLEAAFAEALREGGVAAAVGSDIPGVNRRWVEAAFQALERADVVLGPSPDGGYYLIGLRRPAPDLFRNIPWSSDQVLAVTRNKILALGWKSELLPPLRDVDTLEDWLRLREQLPPGESRFS